MIIYELYKSLTVTNFEICHGIIYLYRIINNISSYLWILYVINTVRFITNLLFFIQKIIRLSFSRIYRRWGKKINKKNEEKSSSS